MVNVWLVSSIILLIFTPLPLSYLYRKGFIVVTIMSSAYYFFGVYTFISLLIFDFGEIIPFNLFSSLDYYEISNVVFRLFVVSGLLCLGGLAAKLFGVDRFHKNNFSKSGEGRSRLLVLLLSIDMKYLSILAILCPLILFLALGPAQFSYREGYHLNISIPLLMKVFMLSLPISCFSAGLVKRRWLRYLLTSIIFLSLLSISSRTLLILPVAYICARYLRNNKIRFYQIVIVSFWFFLSTAIAIEFRNHSLQGLFPNLVHLFTEGVELDSVFFGLNYIFSYGAGVLGVMLNQVNYDPDLFYLAINPLPSSLIDISRVIHESKINPSAPFSAIGEIYSMGWFLSILILILIGLTISILEFITKRHKKLYVTVVLLVTLGTLLSYQYNLRGFSRLLYYTAMLGLYSVCIKFLIFATNKNKV